VREKFQSGKIEIPFVSSQDQLADILTKALDKGSFNQLLIKLGSIDIYEPNLRGSVENKKGTKLWMISEISHHRSNPTINPRSTHS
jgi:hypothetical protein